MLDPDSREARARNQAVKEAKEAAEQAGIEAAMRAYGFGGDDAPSSDENGQASTRK